MEDNCIAKQIRSVNRENDLLKRINGDEYLAIVEVLYNILI